MRMLPVRRTLALSTAALLAAATPLVAAAPASAAYDRVTARGDLVSYDSALVPADARARVLARYDESGDRTKVTLRVHDLLPNRAYGVHVHANPCGATGAVAGPHFQYLPDPVQPSMDPAYANPGNEIWLDLTTDEWGNAVSYADVDWEFPADRRGQSVVIHSELTKTGPGEAGMAGARVGCLTVPF